MLYEDETIEELGIAGRRLIQSSSLFKYGTDAVLLSQFARVKPGGSVLDLCTGSGIIPILLSAVYPDAAFDALEISPRSADMARRSVELNGLGDRITVTTGDVKNARGIYGGRQFDLITCNPPYMNAGGGLVNPNTDKAIARHEILCTLEDVIRESARLLKTGGLFAMVHKVHRLTDIMTLMRENRIEPTRLVFVSDRYGMPPDMLLIEGRRSGGKNLKVTTIYIKENDYGGKTVSLRDTDR